jgi:hypothetical protein
MFLLQACSDSSDGSLKKDPALAQAESAAIASMHEHMEGRNANDAEQVAAANNYPIARIGLGQTLIYDTYEIFLAIQESIIVPNFIADPDWHHSVWDELKVVHSTPHKVHIAARFSRVNAEGVPYLSTDTFWIQTKQEEHWGTKMKSSFVEEAGESRAGVDEAEAAALVVLESYLDRLNSRDSEGIAKLVHYPLVLLQNVELIAFHTPEDFVSYLENTVIKDLDYAEWQHSDLENVVVLQSSPNKVHLVMSCDHLNVVGDSCGQLNEFWVITKEDGRWAIRGLSSL